jgi:hypothetical protein
MQTGIDIADRAQQLLDMWSTTARQVPGGWASLHTEISTPETAPAVAGVAGADIHQRVQTDTQTGQVSRVTCDCAYSSWLTLMGVT